MLWQQQCLKKKALGEHKWPRMCLQHFTSFFDITCLQYECYCDTANGFVCWLCTAKVGHKQKHLKLSLSTFMSTVFCWCYNVTVLAVWCYKINCYASYLNNFANLRACCKSCNLYLYYQAAVVTEVHVHKQKKAITIIIIAMMMSSQLFLIRSHNDVSCDLISVFMLGFNVHIRFR